MKKWFFIVVNLVMVLSLLIAGCDFIDTTKTTDYTKKVKAQVCAGLTGYYYGPGGQLINGPIPGVKVRFDFDYNKGRNPNTLYEVTGSDGFTPYAVVSYNLNPGEEIDITASVEDNSLPSDVYGPVKTWIITPDTCTIPYEDAEYTPPQVLDLYRDTSPPITTSNTSATTTTQTAQQWNLTGDWTLRFAVTTAQGQIYDHHYTISQTGNSFIGTGYTPPTGTVVHNEKVSGTIGTTAINSFTMHISYNDNSYYADFIGTIDNYGEISGTWKDNYKPQNAGDFYTITGAAIPK